LEDEVAYTDDEKKIAEEAKVVHDYYKHLTTLSSGSILIVVTFLEKLTSSPEWQFLVGLSIIAFMVTIVSCVFVSVYTIETMHYKDEGSWFAVFTGLAVIAAWVGFLVGMISLGIFALKNLS